jgi:hypothetical protein
LKRSSFRANSDTPIQAAARITGRTAFLDIVTTLLA